MTIILGNRPANSTGRPGRLRLEAPKITVGDLKTFDVLTELLWVYSLANDALADGAARTELDITGTFKAQTWRQVGTKAGFPVVELTSWGLKTGTFKVVEEIDRNFGMLSSVSANSPGGYLCRGDTYCTQTKLTLTADSMVGIPGPAGTFATTSHFGVQAGAPNTGNASAPGWVLARGHAEAFKGGLQRSERVYLFSFGPSTGTWY